MCLIPKKRKNSTNAKPTKSEHDIIAYKVVGIEKGFKCSNSKMEETLVITRIFSPIYLMEYELGKLYHYTPISTRSNFTPLYEDVVRFGFHTYANLEDAVKLVEILLKETLCEEYNIVKCIIPAQTRFYRGTVDGFTDEQHEDGTFPAGYVSEDIKLMEFIN